MKTPRVIVLGLDGMSIDLLEAVSMSGVMPRTREFLKTSYAKELQSTVPFYTIPGWASIFTGVQPGAHGLLYWRRSDPPLPWIETAERGFVSLSEALRPPVWELLVGTGTRSAFIDIPATFPAPQGHGTFVSGFLGPWPDPRAVWPPTFHESVATMLPSDGIHVSERDIAGGLGPADMHEPEKLSQTIGKLEKATRQRFRLFRSLMKDDLDLIVLVLVGPDRLAHRAWPLLIPRAGNNGEAPTAAVMRFWTTVDAFFGELLRARNDGDAILVCSDHGSQEPPTYRFRSRPWLVDRGYLRPRGIAARVPRSVWSSVAPLAAAMRPRLRRALMRANALPGVERLRDRMRAHFMGVRADGSAADQTVVFDVSLDDRALGFFLGPRTQDRAGLRQRLISDLRRLSFDRLPVFDRVDDAEAILGPVADGVVAPDVIAVSRRDIGVTTGSLYDDALRMEEQTVRGIHKQEGVLLLAADGIENTKQPEVEDVAPTILGLLGFRPPDWMTGQPLAGRRGSVELKIRERSSAARQPVSDEEEVVITEHLRGLGYLE